MRWQGRSRPRVNMRKKSGSHGQRRGYVVCTYAAFPKEAEIVCIMSAATALEKFWNGQIAQRRKR